MAREEDCYELMSMLMDQGLRLVIRLCHDRRLAAGRESTDMLFEALGKAEHIMNRKLALPAQYKEKEPGKVTGTFSR